MIDAVEELAALMIVACIANPRPARVIAFVKARPDLGWPELLLRQEVRGNDEVGAH